MKLLFDQNISFRIVNKLIDTYPDSKHVSQVGLMDCEDIDIWMFARNQDYEIVTYDSDFYDISLINGIPPKIIWIRTGNLVTGEIVQLLKMNKQVIFDFINNPEFKELVCLEIE